MVAWASLKLWMFNLVEGLAGMACRSEQIVEVVKALTDLPYRDAHTQASRQLQLVVYRLRDTRASVKSHHDEKQTKDEERE